MNSDETNSTVRPERQHYALLKTISETGVVRCLPSGKLLSGALYRFLEPKPQQVRETIIKLRKDFRLSRGQMSAYMGCSFSTIKAWERGERKPSAMAIRMIWLVDSFLRGKPAPDDWELLSGGLTRRG